ncbi:hypothetical protein PMAYCL1PPCAC_11182, partial [Pristionchus mayeri]
DNMYEYAPRPICEITRRDCGSKYLYCDVRHNSEPMCMSKIRAGGNCTGFEGTEVCFGAECVKGICQPTVPGQSELKGRKTDLVRFSPFSSFTSYPLLNNEVLNM